MMCSIATKALLYFREVLDTKGWLRRLLNENFLFSINAAFSPNWVKKMADKVNGFKNNISKSLCANAC